ncbi:homolog of yeast sucrose nonfermenting 4 [Hibiscus trionum]|uniref:Homolog of yeast sucrose nonfermenting 4 n=1 Tax=Hibiscus trionum TaxID=183268 RepID=A0A9W7HA90_HIBTR|nr:homolog of yeast sucrose nonfermenting 4 [Hibiscus trionum]
MFASDMNPARFSGGVTPTGVVLFPIQFTWPHGGRSVFLSGSFNGWAELVPMSQVEGCPNVFQAVYAVPHGSHEYKFFVDGEWRHDERQPHKNGEYGIVNTFDARPMLMEVPDVIPQVQSRSDIMNNMEVDNGLMNRISAVALNQAMPRISEEDVQASRHRISLYLTGHTAYELLPESGKVVALDVALPVKQAFHILSEQGIPLAPLWDFHKEKFVGVVSASDFILILRELLKHGSNLTEEELETHSIAAWKQEKAYMTGQVDGHGRPIPKDLIYASPCDNLKDVALKILQNGVAIVPVIHSSEDGSHPQLLHLASLAGILKCICRYFKHCPNSLTILQLPIYAIPLGTWVPRIGETSSRSFAMLRLTASLSSALNMLVEAKVSSIPIVDDNDSLVDIYCRSDITALAISRAYTHNLNEMTVHQALQWGQDSNPPYERTQRCQMCLRTDTLLKVMEQLSNPGVRRLVIVEAGSNRVEGIISLTDIFRFLLG